MQPARDAATVYRSGLHRTRITTILTAANDNRRPSIFRSPTAVGRIRSALVWLHGVVTGAIITALVLGTYGVCF